MSPWRWRNSGCTRRLTQLIRKFILIPAKMRPCVRLQVECRALISWILYLSFSKKQDMHTSRCRLRTSSRYAPIATKLPFSLTMLPSISVIWPHSQKSCVNPWESMANVCGVVFSVSWMISRWKYSIFKFAFGLLLCKQGKER